MRTSARLGIYFLLSVGALLSWNFLSESIAPKLINDIYFEKSTPLLNSIISDRSLPLKSVQNRWHHDVKRVIALRFYTVLALVWLFFFLTLPHAKDYFSRKLAECHAESVMVFDNSRRAIAVCGLMVFLIGGSLTSIFLDRELWPFSPYGMFSNISEDRFTQLKFVGITENSSIDLSEYLSPAGGAIAAELQRIERHKGAHNKVREALFRLLRYYEKRRLEGKHSGPPLRGVQVDQLEFQMDPRSDKKVRLLSRQELYHYLQ